MLHSIQNNDGNPTSVNIKQAMRQIVTNRFTLIVMSALRHSCKENKKVRLVLTKSEVHVNIEMETPHSSRSSTTLILKRSSLKSLCVQDEAFQGSGLEGLGGASNGSSRKGLVGYGEGVVLEEKGEEFGFDSKKDEVVPRVEDVSLVNGVFDGTFGGDGDDDFDIGDAMRRLEWKPWKEMKKMMEKNEGGDHLIKMRQLKSYFDTPGSAEIESVNQLG
ncbi:hypothetical protein Tco_0856467 [Tanacetum coccineum]|uniref:Uncharacterized protein n=1 Tax=Tanacetum coccineum TaxID=301880 RepID=A0ABQ5B3J9_9ASTR